MGEQFSFFYDIAVVIIAVVCVCAGYRKGFMKTAVATGIYIAAFAVSWVSSIYISNILYDDYFKEKNYEIVSEYMQTNNLAERISSELSAKGADISSEDIKKVASDGNTDVLYGIMQKNGYDGSREDFEKLMTQSVSGVMNGMLMNTSLPYSEAISDNVILSNSNELAEILKDTANLDSDYENVIQNICDTYLRPLEIKVIRILVTVILTTVIMIITNIIISKKKRLEGEEMSSIDSFFGGVAGIAASLFYVYIFASAVHMLVSTSKEQMLFFNDAVINKTYIFQYFYRVLLHI